jgi:hypothetical protein
MLEVRRFLQCICDELAKPLRQAQGSNASLRETLSMVVPADAPVCGMDHTLK